jgi:hypothetical protein
MQVSTPGEIRTPDHKIRNFMLYPAELRGQMKHHTKDKGDIAVAKTILDLTIKDYTVFVPAFTEHLPFDIIAYKDNICYRIQCKYSVDHKIKNKSIWSDRNGYHMKTYNDSDFDYYAIYLPDIDKVVYPSIRFGGCKISTTVPNSATPFYWWEDFTNFTSNVTKKSYKNFNIELTHTITEAVIEGQYKRRKVTRPSKEELEKLLWEQPTTKIAKELGVSDKAITKWAKSYGIEKPPRGYWAKLQPQNPT